MTAAWLAAAVRARPRRFPFAVAAAALPDARLVADPSPAFAGEVVGLDDGELRLGLAGLRGAASPLPSAWCGILAGLPAEAPARGLVDAIEHRAFAHLLAVLRSRPVDASAVFAGLLAALAGVEAPVTPELAGALADGATAAGIAAAAAAAAKARIRIVAACGGELPLAAERRPALGRSGRLGRDQALGGSVRGPDLGFRVEVGPVAWSDVERLRPGGGDGAALVAVLRALAPPACAWEVLLLVDTAGAPRPALGSAPLGASARLEGRAAPVERELVHREGCYKLS